MPDVWHERREYRLEACATFGQDAHVTTVQASGILIRFGEILLIEEIA